MNKLKSIFFLCFLFPIVLLGQVEICDNGVDDDGDNLIDLNDLDCICEVVEPVSLIPNPSFEERDCCPSNRSQLNCATDWIQASEPTTDFIHSCDWLGWDQFPPPFPFPDGFGIMGFRDGRIRNNNDAEPQWKEYAGACLLSPLEANITYKFEFDVGFVDEQKSPPINISFFGTASCNFLPFGNGSSTFGCPSNSPDWVKLSDVMVSAGPEGGDNWVNATITVAPTFDINAIAIGPDCPETLGSQSNYYFFDNLLLADLAAFDLLIEETNHPCNTDFTLSVRENSSFEYQWYKDGVALLGETNPTLEQNYGSGAYQVSILDGISCRVSTSFEHIVPIIETFPNLSICDGESYQFGNNTLTTPGFYLDTLTSFQNCDSIVSLTLDVIGQEFETIDANILEGASFEAAGQSFTQPGEYPLTLTSFLGCDSLVLLNLSTFNVFIPNIFSPNQDGFNDVFRPSAATGLIENVDLIIFDRWGSQVYRGEEWSAREADQGVYVYTMLIEFTNGDSNLFAGDVTVVK